MIHLLKYFKTLSLHPENAKEIRALILELAIRGRLTEEWRREHQEVEPASVLLERIREEKARLVKEKVIRKRTKSYNENTDFTEQKVPSTWATCVLDDLGVVNPRNSLQDDTPVGFVPMKSISEYFEPIPSFEKRAWSKVKKNFTHFRNDDIAFAKITPCFENGKAAVFQNLPSEYGAGTTELHVLRLVDGSVLPQFVYILFKSPSFIQDGEKVMTGSAGQKRVPTSYLYNKRVGLPPLKEQKAIVATVNRLLAEVDELEQQTTRFQALRQDYVTASLRALTGEDSGGAWAALRPHFQSFFNQENGVKKLRAAILELAVQGKLTAGWRAENPDVEPAEVLLERIGEEKARLVREKVLRKEKSLPDINTNELPFSVPANWSWCRLGEIVKFMAYGTSQKTNSDDSLVPVLRMGNITSSGELKLTNFKYISPDHKDLPKLYLENNDIVFNRTNSYALVGKSAVFKEQNRKFTLASYLIKVSLFDSFVDSEYVNKYIVSPVCRETQIEPQITAQTNQANFSGSKLKAILLPLPPLPEQKAIVKIVDKLMALCDRLEGQIEEREAVGGAFLRASVGELLVATENVAT